MKTDSMEKAEKETVIRMAKLSDAQEILDIYAWYVKESAVTFEYEVPSLMEFQQRMIHILQKYPYLVAEENGEIKGYAYAGVFKGRRAYDWACETTIYIKKSCRGQGFGKKLYHALEKILRQQNIQNMYACIAASEEEDVHFTNDSPKFHAHMGFTFIGTFSKCGYKFGKWYDMIWMEKMLGEHEQMPKDVIWLPELSDLDF